MLSIHDQLSDVTKRIARAKARVCRQRAHIEGLMQLGHDTADATALLALMASALEQMREVQSTLQEFCQGQQLQ